MFDFSFPELLIIGIVAVLVLDPRHLPGVARSAGRWMGRARRMMDKMRADLDEHIGEEHLAPLRELNDEWQRTKSLLTTQVPREWLEDDEGEDSKPGPEELAAPREASTSTEVTAGSTPGQIQTPRRRRGGRRRGAHPATRKPKSTARKTDGRDRRT